MKKKTTKALVEFYRIPVKQAHYHNEGNWYWNLTEFPGAYFDDRGVVIFETERDYFECVYLQVGPNNTWVRDKDKGMNISDIPTYKLLDPPPMSLWLASFGEIPCVSHVSKSAQFTLFQQT